MTVKHIAWIRFKDDVTAERIEQHLKACRGLPEKVPALISLECGPNISDRAGGFTHGIVATLADRQAMPAYLEHPDHLVVADPLKEDVAELRVMDIEFD